jgi:hypothetical protein
MTDENEKVNNEEQTEIFSVKQGEGGFAFSRRDFLVAAAGSTAAAVVGAGMHALSQSDPSGQAEAPDDSQIVSLEIDALGMLVAPLASSIQRSWRILNKGKTTCPEGVLEITAEHEAALKLEINVPEIAPGQRAEALVSLTAPQMPGEYRYQWQLRLGEGRAKQNEFVVYVPDATLAESLHPYLANTNQTWTINNPDPSAASSFIHFSRLEVEKSFDNVFVKDGGGNVVQSLTGSYPNGLWSQKVNGAVVQVQLVSDVTIQGWGFRVDEIRTTLFVTYMPIIYKPKPTPTSYVICTCNTVDVCTCNLVCVCEAVCSCVGYCSCDTVCTCDSQCTCNTVHYWYPN